MNIIDVTTLHGTEIKYDTEKKQFFAHVGGRDIRKSSQRDVEKFIRKMKIGSERVKGIVLNYSWRTVTAQPIEIVGLRGNKVQYKSGEHMESESAADVYIFDQAVLDKALELRKEHDSWMKRWEALLDKAKKIDPASLK